MLSEETTEDAKKDMFERINRGSDLLKPMEKRKGIYTGSFCSFIYDYCSENILFQELVQIDKWLIKRQEREELLLRFFALSDTNAYLKGINQGISTFLDDYLEGMNKKMSSMTEDEKQNIINDYSNRINAVVNYVKKNFPFGFRHKYNPQTKRSVFEAISVGVWLGLKSEKAKEHLSKDDVIKTLDSENFKQYTHVANELHKRTKLHGRIETIYQLVTGTEGKIDDIS